MKLLLVGLFGLSLPFTAAAFPVDVEVQSDGVSIVASSSYLSNIATVTLVNEGAENALCEARFVNGPERPLAAASSPIACPSTWMNSMSSMPMKPSAVFR